MSVPILLITGFLGAGKTTLINRLLTEPQGRRLAAVVNDFGAIDIDAALLAGVSDDVISLKNGCICCSLQGDLLRTLSTILRRDPAPDGIVIETSGVSDPAEIVRALLDPVIWTRAALDAVICVADARLLADEPGLSGDCLWRSQLDGADFVAVSKLDHVNEQERDRVGAALRRHKPDRAIYPMPYGALPPELLFSADLHRPGRRLSATPVLEMPAFETVSWTSDATLTLDSFQRLISTLGKVIVRSKGIVTFAEKPSEPMLFQLVGTRATISQAPAHIPLTEPVQLVFIARTGTLDRAALKSSLDRCRAL